MADARNIDIAQMRAILGQNAEATPKKPIATMTKGKDGTIDVTEEVLDALFQPIFDRSVSELKPVLSKTIADSITEESKVLENGLEKQFKSLKTNLGKQAAELEKAYNQSIEDLSRLAKQVRPIEVVTSKSKKGVKLDGVQHHKFELLLHVVGANLPVFMVGPAGTGKTAAAETVARSLGLKFYAISVGSQTSKSDIFGYKDANGAYHPTAFRIAYENGGVFLLDEADAGNANVLVGLNAALSNGYVFFPDAKQVKMHDDFRMIATANTFGNGASRQYVGRNQLDAATMDRFTVMTWDIDDRIEESLAALSPTFGTRWLRVVREVRDEAINKLELRAVVSPRATMRGALLLESGVTYEDAVQVALIANMPEVERPVLLNIANAAWAKGEPKKKGRPAGSVNKPKVDLDNLVSVFDGAEGVDDDE
jgi:MoxR-like ATPases